MPGHEDVAGKPPAVIFDVDETVVSNAAYQKTLATAPYTPFRHFDWMRNNAAVPVRGAVAMVAAARAAGVAVFFVTNRACETFDGVEGDCPYEQVTIDDLAEIVEHKRSEVERAKSGVSRDELLARARDADVLVTMDATRREIAGGGLFAREGTDVDLWARMPDRPVTPHRSHATPPRNRKPVTGRSWARR